ncbi:MAG: hypothetical protein RL266_118 [Bacteroidota bacterium]|jgi:hypothetical protein
MRKTIVIFSVLVAAALALSGIFENEAMYGKIHADAQGYYGYLVGIFLEHSLDWEQVIHSYADVYFDGGGADFTVTSELGRVNKYYVGTAVLMLPFFLVTCLIAWALGFPVDGYSIPFHYGAMFGALFYVGIGMYFLALFIEKRGIRPWIAFLASILCLFATPLFHYSVSEPAMSHAYSFGLFGLFLFLVDKWYSEDSRGVFLLASVVFGLVVLIRPINGLLILSALFISGGFAPLKSRILSDRALVRKLVFAAIVIGAILSIQSFMYLAQVGKPIVWSYQGEGFNFRDPEILNFLFSYKKGLFVYTPFALLGLIGMVLLAVKKPGQGVWLLIFILIVVYVLSSWWNWYYGSSLGMRAMVEFMPFFAVGLAFLLNEVNGTIRAVLLFFCLLFSYVNLVQSYQYQKFILHWVGMDKDRFWTIFMKTDRRYDGIFYREEQKAPEVNEEQILDRVVFESDLEDGTNWGPQGRNEVRAVSGKWSTMVNAESPYGSTLGIPVSELGITGSRKLHITAKVWSEQAYPNLTIAYSYRGNNGDYGHDYVSLGHLVTEPDKWLTVETLVPMNLPSDSLASWIVYPHNTSKVDVYLDDIRYEVLTLRDQP